MLLRIDMKDCCVCEIILRIKFYIVMEIIGVILGILLVVGISRWVFRIDTIADNLIYQTNLLKKIAEKSEVSIEEINSACGIKTKKK